VACGAQGPGLPAAGESSASLLVVDRDGERRSVDVLAFSLHSPSSFKLSHLDLDEFRGYDCFSLVTTSS
jgi:hypothetical protein